MDEAEVAFFVRRGRQCYCFPWHSHQRVGGAARVEEESWWQRAVDAVLKVQKWSEPRPPLGDGGRRGKSHRIQARLGPRRRCNAAGLPPPPPPPIMAAVATRTTYRHHRSALEL
uniref:Uncharacterized protein n=1 Tax=Oryza brachyantha TaxID=4533 RepID=J3MNB8_ORYBR